MSERVISSRLYIKWGPAGAYVDESAYLISARGDMRFSPPESSITAGRGMISNMSLTLRNADGRFSPLRTDGPLYAYIGNGGMYNAACYLEVSIDNGNNYDRVFTGLLKLPQLSTLTTKQTPTITLEARSLEERLLQRRTSTSRADFATYHDDGYTEAQLINAWLADAGVLVANRAIDTGLFTIPWAWLDDESPVEEMWSLAGACAGRYYADPDGIHRYENMAHWQVRERSTTVQRRYTKDDYRALSAAYDDKDLYNNVTVETAPRTLGASALVWEADDPINVQAGQTVTVTARFDTALYQVDLVSFAARSAGGSDLTSSVAVSVTYQAQRASVAITNSAAVLAYVYPIEIYGQALTGGPTQEETVTSADDGDNATWFTERGISRTRSLRGNLYIQERAHAATIAQYILHRHEYPTETWKLTDCSGYPDLRLGDRIEIADNDWHEKDGAAGEGVSLISDATRIISADETIAVVAIIVSSTVTVAGTWIIADGDVSTVTTISSPLSIPINTERTDTSGQTVIDGPVLIQATKEVTVQGHWLLRAEGVYALLLAIAWQLDRAGFKQSLEAIAVDHLFRHDGEYFLLNTTGNTLNGAKVVFY